MHSGREALDWGGGEPLVTFQNEGSRGRDIGSKGSVRTHTPLREWLGLPEVVGD